MTITRRRVLLGLPTFLLTAVYVSAGLMLHTETTIPVPNENETIPLQRLIYESRRFRAAVTSVRLLPESRQGADPVRADWVFTGSNTDGQVHRLEMQIRLLDESGKQIGWFMAKHPLPAGANEQNFSVQMKVKPDVWSATKRVRIFADWIT